MKPRLTFKNRIVVIYIKNYLIKPLTPFRTKLKITLNPT